MFPDAVFNPDQTFVLLGADHFTHVLSAVEGMLLAHVDEHHLLACQEAAMSFGEGKCGNSMVMLWDCPLNDPRDSAASQPKRDG
jgi:hypothetical protein